MAPSDALPYPEPILARNHRRIGRHTLWAFWLLLPLMSTQMGTMGALSRLF